MQRMWKWLLSDKSPLALGGIWHLQGGHQVLLAEWICLLSHCCDQMPEERRLRGGEACSVSRIKGFSLSGWELMEGVALGDGLLTSQWPSDDRAGMEGRSLHAAFSLQLLVSELLGQDLTSSEWRLVFPESALTDMPRGVSAGWLPIYSSLGQIHLGLMSPLLTTSDRAWGAQGSASHGEVCNWGDTGCWGELLVFKVV